MAKTAGQVSSKALLALIEKGNAADGTRMEEVRQLAAQYADASTFARNCIARKLLTKWQITQLSRGTWQLSLGKYRLLEERGIGRIGRELVAEHVNLGRKVVVKLVSRILTADPVRLQRFLQDFRKVAAIDYPHLVHSFDVDQEAQRYFVVTEFVDGDNLEQRITREDPLTPEVAVHLLNQAAKGLAFAAAQGMIHCDLKPANLVVDKLNNLKVTDLGYVRLIDGSEVSSEKTKDAQEQAFNAGMEYRAPEQLNGTADWSDPRLDLFSFGQILFFITTGLKPETPPAEKAARRKLISDHVPELPAPLVDLFAKLTAPVAAERPKTWAEVLPVLAEFCKPANGKSLSDSQTIELTAVAPKPSESKERGEKNNIAAKEVPATKAGAAPAPKPKEAAKPTPTPAPKQATKPAATKKPVEPKVAVAEEQSEAEVIEDVSEETPAAEAPAFDFSSFSPPTKNKPKAAAPPVENKKPAVVEEKKATKPTEKPKPADETPAAEESEAEQVEEEQLDLEEEQPATPGFNFASFTPPEKTKSKAAAPAKVDVKKEAKKPAPVAEQKAAANEAVSSETTPAENKAVKGQKFKLDPKLLIGAIAGVAIILIGLGSLVLYMLMSSKGKAKPNESEVANAENDKQNAKKGKVDDKKQTATKLDTPEKTETPKTEEKTPEAATNEEFNPADLKKKKPAETTLDPEKAVAVVETPKIEPPVTEPKEEPVTPPPDETPLPTPPPVDPPKPAPPMPAADPFKDLPEYFKLPDVAAEKPETIGLVNLAGKVCIVELAGGANASKGKQAFELKNANNGTDPTKWEITLTGKPGEPETVVAGMRIHENQLQFGWTSSGRASPVAPYLMNCVMRLSVGSFTKRITFRQPSITPPLKIDLDKPTPLKFAFDTAPDAKNLRLEIIVTPENGFGSPDRIESSHEIGKSTTLVWLGDNESNRYAGLRFESKASAKGMDVNVTTWVRFDTSQKDSNIVFIKKKFATQAVIAENLVAAANQSMDARMAQADKLPEEQKRGAKALLETDLKALSDARDRFKIIENYMKTLDKNATLHARIVYDTVDLGKVVLAQTEGAPELKKPEVKK